MADLSLALLGPPVVDPVRRAGQLRHQEGDRRAGPARPSTGREQSRERLAVLLWPDADTARARASLRRTLSVTAAAVGRGLLVTRSAVALDPAGCGWT